MLAELRPGEAREVIVDRTTWEPLVERNPKTIYAASAFGSLALGFGTAAAILARGRHTELARANVAVTILCGGIAARLRGMARPVVARGRRQTRTLEDRKAGTTLDYSIVVPVFNRPTELRALLRALADIGAGARHLGSGEIVVVDDGSTDATATVARELAPAMSLPTRVISKENGGVSSARNAGFAVARGEICVVIDSDCLPEPAWLEAMLTAVRADPKLLVFARIRQNARPAYPLENLPDCKGFVGASFAMLRDAYLQLGGCHEAYGASHDDRDLVLTALDGGHDVAHAVHGWIEHPMRYETIGSIWRAGLNSRFGNLYALRHGAYARSGLRPTPYYFLGVGSNCVSSIAFIVAASNALLLAAAEACSCAPRTSSTRTFVRMGLPLLGTYVACLALLGIATGAGPRRLPRYVATLAALQVATLAGHLRGTIDYGLFLL